jgi:hypothetical protein
MSQSSQSTPSQLPRHMTRRRATEILLNAAQAHLRGAGCGLAERPSEHEEMLIKAAALRLWRDAYNFDMPRSWPR